MTKNVTIVEYSAEYLSPQKEQGGESLEVPKDLFWGDRVGMVSDFAGNKWMIATHVEDVDSEELDRRVEAMMAA